MGDLIHLNISAPIAIHYGKTSIRTCERAASRGRIYKAKSF